MDNLTKARIELVRKYLAHPQSWPDGIEWKDGDHWYTRDKLHWDKLARNEKSVTETPERVTKTINTVTETRAVTETLKKAGRPKTGAALSGAERARRLRARKIPKT